MGASRAVVRWLRSQRRRGTDFAGETALRIAAPWFCPPTREPVDPPQRIFVLRNNDLGDVLVATPLLAALARSHPEGTIEIGVGAWAMPILEHNPNAKARLVPAPWANKYSTRQSFADRWRFIYGSEEAAALSERSFDVGIDVLGSRWGALLLRRCAIPARFGVRGYAGGHSIATATIPFEPAEHVARFGLRFAEVLGARTLPAPRPQLFLDHAERARGESVWTRSSDPRIVVAPGGGLAEKRWGNANFAAFSATLQRTHPESEILVLAGPGEQHLVDVILAAAPRARTATTVPSLRELFGVIASADAVICNSSVQLHIAAAFSTPALTVLGPAFPSARQHQRQWGYDGLSVSLGGEHGSSSGPVTPERAFAVFEEQFWPQVATRVRERA